MQNLKSNSNQQGDYLDDMDKQGVWFNDITVAS